MYFFVSKYKLAYFTNMHETKAYKWAQFIVLLWLLQY